MQASELRTKTDKELATELSKLKKEAMNLRFQQVSGELAKPSRIKEVRRDVARIKTIMNEKKREGEKK